MNNTIDNVNNISFNSRYLNVKSLEKLPPRISDAILKNEAIDEFIKAGQPKRFIGKVLDLFKWNEKIDVVLETAKIPFPVEHPVLEKLQDPYQKVETLIFKLTKRSIVRKTGKLSAEQSGIKRQAGSIPKPNEHYEYKPPIISAEDKLVAQVMGIRDFAGLLK